MTMKRCVTSWSLSLSLCALWHTSAGHGADLVQAKDGSGVYGYKDTPKLPWCGYLVHDPDRPAPKRVQVGPATQPAAPPSDALVLFDGKDLSKWQPTDCKLVDGCIEAVGSLTSKESFGNCQIHLEWMAPANFKGPWYNQGNNGVMLMGLYEIQIFDSWNEQIYPDGQAAAIYAQTPPRVNVCRPPGEWQTYVKLWGKGVVLRGILTGAGIAASRQMVARRGQFILSRIDARNGALGIVPPALDKAIVTNDFPVFNVVENRVLPACLGWMCRTASFVEECKRASEGTANRVRLQEDKFLAREVPLPPLPEQRRVGARIEALAPQIHEARTLRQQAAEEAEALTAAGSREFLSGTWPQLRLEDVCPVITDVTHQTPRYTEEGAIFLSAQNVKPFRFMPEKHRKVSLEDCRGYTARNKPQRGDVLLTRVGAGIGEAAIVDQDIEFAIYVSLALVRTDSTRLSPEFLVQWLNSPAGRASSHRETLGGGTSQGNLNLKLLRGVVLPVPPLPSQRRIVSELDALPAEVDALKRLQAETAAELAALLPALLDRAFKGEL
jgi:type I restriction enzyme S subunit